MQRYERRRHEGKNFLVQFLTLSWRVHYSHNKWSDPEKRNFMIKSSNASKNTNNDMVNKNATLT